VEDGEANRHVVFKDAPGHRLVQGRWRASIFSVVVLVVLDAEHDVDAGVDSEVGDLFDNGGGAPDVNDSLVDAHLVVVVGVGTVTARGTARRDGEHLGGDALGARDLEALLLAAGNDLGAGVFKGLDVTAAEGHSNLVDFLVDLNFLLHVFLCFSFMATANAAWDFSLDSAPAKSFSYSVRSELSRPTRFASSKATLNLST